jgi:hypothetical protein
MCVIQELMKDRTVLIIAHRLSTIKNSDCIFVIDVCFWNENFPLDMMFEKIFCMPRKVKLWKRAHISNSWNLTERILIW